MAKRLAGSAGVELREPTRREEREQMDGLLNPPGTTAVVNGSVATSGRRPCSFAGRDADLVVNARANRDGAEAGVVMDGPRELSAVDEMVRTAVVRSGRIDILVSNAAQQLQKDAVELTHDEQHRPLDQQLTGSWCLAKTVVPAWARAVGAGHPLERGGRVARRRPSPRALGGHGAPADLHPGAHRRARAVWSHRHRRHPWVHGDGARPTTHRVDAAFTQMSIAELIAIRRQVTGQRPAWLGTSPAGVRPVR